MSLSSMASGFGGVLGCISGGLINQYAHPYYSFMTSSFSGLILAYFAYNLPISCEIV